MFWVFLGFHCIQSQIATIVYKVGTSTSSIVQHLMMPHSFFFPSDHENLSKETKVQQKQTKIKKFNIQLFQNNFWRPRKECQVQQINVPQL